MKKIEKKKIKFKRSRIVITLIYLTVTVAVFASLAFIPRDPELRYLRHVVVALGALIAVLTIISFLKLFTYEIRMELYRRISQAMFNASEKWRSFKAAVRRKLGLPERAEMRGRDERNIVMDPERASRKARKNIRRIKYSDMHDNKMRIRFLWLKYVAEHTGDNDPPVISDTPEKILRKINDPHPNKDIFALYRTARYTSERTVIDSDAVSAQAELIGTKGKI